MVKSAEDARKTIKFLNENNVGRIAILIFNAKTQRRRGAKDKRQSIKDFLGVSDDFAEFLSEVFPREMAAQMVEDFDYKQSDETFATLDGDLSFGGKFFICGKPNANEKNISLLAFKRELRELETKSHALSKEIERTDKETETARLYLTE